MAGCGDDASTAVAVTPPTATAATVEACTRLTAALPAKVDDAARRPTDPQSPLIAAWGDPTVVLRCGVARPADLTSTSHLETINGIDWLLLEKPGQRIFTTAGRAVYIELTIPAGHDPQVGPLVDVAAAVATVAVKAEKYPKVVSTAAPGAHTGH